MPADLADILIADVDDRKTDRAPLAAVTENEEVATLSATIENLPQGGAVVKEEVATETETRESVVLDAQPHRTAHVVLSFSCPMTCHKSTGRATLA